MTDLVLLLVPFFALVLMGWGAARGRLLPLDGIGALNSFVLYFGLSAMVFRLAASGALHQAGLGGLLLAYGLAGGVVAVLALAWARRAGLSRLDGGLAALATAFPNTGFLGLPLLTGLLGTQAAGPVAATLVVDVLLLSSVCLAWAHSAPALPRPGVRSGADMRHALANALRGAMRNPLLWAMALGMVAAELSLVLPHALNETLRLLGLSATPTALFTLGAILARSQMVGSGRASTKCVEAVADAMVRAPLPMGSVHADAKAGEPIDASSGSRASGVDPTAWLPALLKLVLHPGLVWGVGQALPVVGVLVPAGGLVVLIMAAALPSASNVAMLAEREGANTALVARIILWTTAAALGSLALWAGLLGVRATTGTA